jgi:hypothetical protein
MEGEINTVNYVFWGEKYPIFTNNGISADFGRGFQIPDFHPPIQRTLDEKTFGKEIRLQK